MTQDSERNKATVRRFYEESHKGNLDVYEEVLAPEFVSFSSAAGGELRGIDAFKQAYVMFSDAFEGFNTTIDVIVAEGNEVAVYGKASGKHVGAFMGVEPTGKDLEWEGIAIYRFNDDGLIDGRWQQVDTVAMATQLGMIPS